MARDAHPLPPAQGLGGHFPAALSAEACPAALPAEPSHGFLIFRSAEAGTDTATKQSFTSREGEKCMES